METNAFPLSAHMIVRQIIKHTVQTVATQHNVLLSRAIHDQTPIHVNAGTIMKIERHTVIQSQRCPFTHNDTSIDNHRNISADGHIAFHNDITHHIGIPRPSVQIHFLLYPTLQAEHQVVLYLLRRTAMVQR